VLKTDAVLLINFSKFLDWGHSRRKRADHQPSSIPNYYAEYIDETIRYVELVFIADNSIVNHYNFIGNRKIKNFST
jgi:hypothetical protein